MRWIFLLGAGAGLLLRSGPQREPDEPLSIPHILRLPVLSDLAPSPDGKRVATTVASHGRQHVWTGEKPDESGELVTPGKARDREPDWSPDGRSIAFVSDRGGKPHIFVATLGEKDARQVTNHEGEDRRPRFSPDGKTIAFLSRRLGTVTEWDLWVTPTQGGTPQPLSKDPLDEDDPRWSPDGKRIAFTTRAGRHVERRVAVVAAAGGEPRSLVPSDWKGDTFGARFAPDGARVAFVSDRDGRKAVYVVPVVPVGPTGAGEPQILVRSEFEETEPAWSPDGKEIVHVSNRDGNLHLAVTTVETHETRTITRGAGVHGEPQYLPDGTGVMCFFEGPLNPRDVWVYPIRSGGRRRLSETLPEEIDVRQMARPELVRYASGDGRTITGFLYVPAKASATAPVPLLVRPHGGPTSQWLNGWHPFEQYLVQKGFAVFAPNVRGSSGFGVEFENANDKDWGRGDLDDLVAGARQIAARPEIRDDRIALWGVSYGGFLTLAALGRYPDLFACAIEAVGMPDLEKLYRETNAEGRSYLDRELGPLAGNLKLYRDLSPSQIADRVKTPLLSFHGEVYPLVPYSTKKPFLDLLKARRRALVDFLFSGENARGTYRPELYPDGAKGYMEKVEEFLGVYL